MVGMVVVVGVVGVGVGVTAVGAGIALVVEEEEVGGDFSFSDFALRRFFFAGFALGSKVAKVFFLAG